MIGLVEVQTSAFESKILKILDVFEHVNGPVYSRQLRAVLFAINRSANVQIDIEFFYQVHRDYESACAQEQITLRKAIDNLEFK